jgi:DNA-binding GntR family transcriptional regulator
MTTAVAARHTTAERLAAEIREAILSGKLPPGTPLREEVLARANEVSRHAVREALRDVVSEGLATYEAYKGARVSYISTEDVEDVYGARLFLETGALQRLEPGEYKRMAHIHAHFTAAVQGGEWAKAYENDVQFHSAIVAATKSRRLVAWHAELFQVLSRAHLVRPDFQEVGLRASVAQHAQILVALTAGDVEAATAALSDHLVFSERLLTRPEPVVGTDAGCREMRS